MAFIHRYGSLVRHVSFVTMLQAAVDCTASCETRMSSVHPVGAADEIATHAKVSSLQLRRLQKCGRPLRQVEHMSKRQCAMCNICNLPVTCCSVASLAMLKDCCKQGYFLQQLLYPLQLPQHRQLQYCTTQAVVVLHYFVRVATLTFKYGVTLQRPT